jgi:hypothetical protein
MRTLHIIEPGAHFTQLDAIQYRSQISPFCEKCIYAKDVKGWCRLFQEEPFIVEYHLEANVMPENIPPDAQCHTLIEDYAKLHNQQKARSANQGNPLALFDEPPLPF